MRIDPIMKNLCEGAPGVTMPKGPGGAESTSLSTS